MMRFAWICLLILSACNAQPDLAIMQLPLAAELPDSVRRVELRLDDAVYQLDRPFPADWVIDVEPGAIATAELVARDADDIAVWYGQQQDIEAVADTVVDVDLILDPAGEMRLTTIQTLGAQITLFAVPANPPPNTPLRYPVAFEGLAYARVLPAGRYAVRAQIDGGVIMPETTIATVDVDVGQVSNADLDLSELQGLGDLF